MIAVAWAGLLAVLAYAVANIFTCKFPFRPYCAEIGLFGPFYGERLRGSLFAGFLTLGGFLLSLKTFIIVNMKKEVFDTKEYQDSWELMKRLDNKGRMKNKFEPLRYLSQTLFLAIASCVCTAVLQLTLGLAETWWAASICLWACAVSMIFLSRSLLLIRINLNRMFDFLDERDENAEKPK